MRCFSVSVRHDPGNDGQPFRRTPGLLRTLTSLLGPEMRDSIDVSIKPDQSWRSPRRAAEPMYPRPSAR